MVVFVHGIPYECARIFWSRLLYGNAQVPRLAKDGLIFSLY